jgi:hypothetical protein
LFTYCTQNPEDSNLGIRKKHIEEIGKELYTGREFVSMQNMCYSVDIRIKEETGKDVRPYRALWNGITEDQKY